MKGIMSRWFRFFIAVAIGFGLGLLYGWVISPVEYVDTNPETLRADYRADYVLMVAEAYHAEKDLNLAMERLAFLGFSPPLELVEQAMAYAVQKGYAPADLGLLRSLNDALAAATSVGVNTQP